ncbi:hypothetical protein [Paracidovorax wautersii]|uniref:hypothetical protein n=1 Tax=Paracidovorax wautersii TaxID=1177982 RepID=UPI0031D08EE1
MNTYAITYRTPEGLRMRPVQAASLAAAWDSAFATLAALGSVRGFGVRRLVAGA